MVAGGDVMVGRLLLERGTPEHYSENVTVNDRRKHEVHQGTQ